MCFFWQPRAHPHILRGRWAVPDPVEAIPPPAADPMSLGKSTDKFMELPKTGVTFADVAGVDGAKQELQEVPMPPGWRRDVWGGGCGWLVIGTSFQNICYC